jgi:hypothetical protein
MKDLWFDHDTDAHFIEAAKTAQTQPIRESAARAKPDDSEAVQTLLGHQQELENHLDEMRKNQVSRDELDRKQHELDQTLQKLNDARLQTPEVTAPQSSGPRWAIIIGVSQYQFSGQAGLNNLAFADKDADDFAAELKREGWNPDHVLLLTNEHASKREIEHALESWLRRADPGDDVVIFWSGHGWPDATDPERAYFGCYDSLPSDPSSGMRMDYVRRAIEERQPRHVIFIADTCHSGMAIRGNNAKSITVVPALEAMDKKKDIPKGWVFVASADSDRNAYEDKAWKHGALTQVLLEGMSGKADGYKSAGPKDGIVTLGELKAYVTDRMGEESLNVVGAKLLPLFYTTSGDPGIWDLDLRGK